MFIVPFLSSLQLLPTVWSMCFLYGVVSKHSGESSTRYGSHIEMPTQGDLHSRISLVNYLITGLVFLCLCGFQIIKKSCIEILAAEPSSVCAGGKEGVW